MTAVAFLPDVKLPVEGPPTGPGPGKTGPAFPLSIERNDDLLAPEAHRQVREFLDAPGWKFGWKSQAKKDPFSFWHKHFAGHVHPDHGWIDPPPDEEERGRVDRAAELARNAPVIHALWQGLQATLMDGHRLVRCYANAFSFGCDGTLHTDSRRPDSYTAIYYPNDHWEPDWGGETIFFNTAKTDIVGAVYPKPNRLVMFNGTIPHVARGLARGCPALRITLMFKTQRLR